MATAQNHAAPASAQSLPVYPWRALVGAFLFVCLGALASAAAVCVGMALAGGL